MEQRLEKIKRPGGVYWFDLIRIGHDEHGTWLRGSIDSPWSAPHDSGVLTVPLVVLLAEGRPWAAWWVADPADPRLEIDVCLPPERTATGWRYIDLELDPIRHENESRVEIEDWDEYEEARRAGWMSAADAELAVATAEDLAAALRRGDDPWQAHGWRLLRTEQKTRE